SSNDTIQFTDVNFSEVSFRKDGNNLVIYGYNDGDSITVNDFFYSNYYEIENFVFKDHTLTVAELKQHDFSSPYIGMASTNRSIAVADDTGYVATDLNKAYEELNQAVGFDSMNYDSWDFGQKQPEVVFSQAEYNDQCVVAAQVNQMIMAMATFGTGANDHSVAPDQLPSLVLQNQISAYGG
ncbi:calcium-binding protein, partial [Neisseriaceae bacterium ESL0693]|nr:calcium-binding protein [Neisseriaceae bacterium ESL0693]